MSTKARRDILEGLNAITDNAGSWTPEQIRQYAQALAIEVDSLGDYCVDALDACDAAAAVLEVVGHSLAHHDMPDTGQVLHSHAQQVRAAIAKARGGAVDLSDYEMRARSVRCTYCGARVQANCRDEEGRETRPHCARLDNYERSKALESA